MNRQSFRDRLLSVRINGCSSVDCHCRLSFIVICDRAGGRVIGDALEAAMCGMAVLIVASVVCDRAGEGD